MEAVLFGSAIGPNGAPDSISVDRRSVGSEGSFSIWRFAHQGMPAMPAELIGENRAGGCLMESESISAWHQPVMGAEVLRYLNPRSGATFLDGTVGTGGHSLLLLPPLLPDGRLVAVDRDGDSLQRARQRLVEFAPHVTFIHDNHRNLSAILKRLGLSGVDGLLLDLGLSSLHVDEAQRGFSFLKEGPLDMRMDREQALTAARLVNESSADQLIDILRRFGEERFAGRIAHRIVEARRTSPLTSTAQLVRVVVDAIPPRARHGRLHAATRTFQALRIAVNAELSSLEECLEALRECLNPGARAAILTFHSLEDRLVKKAFAQGERDGVWKVLTKKPVCAREEEVGRNLRARSAKLRAIEKR